MKKLFFIPLAILIFLSFGPVDWDTKPTYVVVPIMIIFVLSGLILATTIVAFIMSVVDPHGEAR